MQLSDLEVVWPLYRSHYLSPALADEGLVMPIDPASADAPTTASVDVAPTGARWRPVLLASPDGSQQRVSDLLGISRRTLGRMVDVDCPTAWRDPQALEGARTCLAETTSHGSTAEERDAATAWLEEAARSEHHGSRGRRRPRRRRAR